MSHALTLILATALTAGALAPASAQAWRDRLNQGADAVRRGAGHVADNVQRSVEGTVDLMTDEATPEATRAELDAMAFETLQRLFAEQPEAAALFEQSAGYAVFDTRRMTLLGFTAGAGRGVAVSKTTGDRIYMNMGTGGVGLSLGLGGFETQVVILFQSDAVFDHFVSQGYDATAEAGTMFNDDKTRGAVRFADGRSIFYLTRQGWKVSASAAGTKYWPDLDLNAPRDPFYLNTAPAPYDPNAVSGQYDPNAVLTPYDPNAVPGPYDPSAPAGSVVPYAAPAPLDPNTAPAPLDPNAAPNPPVVQ